jgi:hypothetical protein
MRQVVVALLLFSGCSRKNPDALACTLGVDCPGDDLAQSSALDLAGLDLAGEDLSGVSSMDLAGADLAGLDLSAPDLAGLDLSAPDLSGPDLREPGTPCPVVMLILDESGSMDLPLPNVSTTHLQAAKNSLSRLVDHYGSRVPFGLTVFQSPSQCTDGISVVVEPARFSATAVQSGIAAAVSGGSTNTGNAIDVVAADSHMHDPMREGSFVVLVTDGAANCDAMDPKFAATQVDTAAKASQPIKTYVVGIDLQGADSDGVELMSIAGQERCTSGFCNGHGYYPAASESELDKALDLVLNDLVKGCGDFACFPSGAPCTGGTSCCGTVGCVNLQSDSENCGSCGHKCFAGGCDHGTCPSVDMLPLEDLQPPPDQSEPDLGQCSCDKACSFGCVAHNCCFEDTLGAGGCVATPNLCACSGFCL